MATLAEGGRITERLWRDTFRKLDVSPPAAGGKYIYIGAQGPKDRRVDAITGATGTSTALEGFLNRRIEEIHRAASALAGSAAPAAEEGD